MCDGNNPLLGCQEVRIQLPILADGSSNLVDRGQRQSDRILVTKQRITSKQILPVCEQTVEHLPFYGRAEN